MASRISPYVDNTGLVFAYDLANVNRSYLGQPTTNSYGNSFRDFTGTGYSPDGEWTSDPTRLTKTYYANYPTPVGPGATLIEESGTTGFHHLSRYGGGDESGAHSLSIYIQPLASGITDFCIGMLADGNNNIQFNLDTRTITYGGGISNRNAFIRDVPGWPGWLRVGANFEGRGGGWVGVFGYSTYTSYTGTAGGKKSYITGLQYEAKTHPTQFTAGTRSVTQGLKDLTGRSTIDLTNVSFDANAQMTFDGTDDQIVLDDYASSIPYGGTITVETIVKFYSFTPNDVIVAYGGNNTNFGWLHQYEFTAGLMFGIQNNPSYGAAQIGTEASQQYLNKFIHMVGTYDGTTVRLYINGNSVASQSYTAGIPQSTTFRIGNESGRSYYSNMDLPLTRIYNRALPASEIQQNFNAIKGRYGL